MLRTGAIFARGSCRALKWMALVGMVFALGSGQALAQATFTGGEWAPGSNTITLNMSEAVYGSPATTQFTVMVDADGVGTDASPVANTVTRVNAGTSGAPRRTITLTVTNPIMTISTVAVGYTAPSDAAAATNIRNSANDVTATIASITAPTELNSIPTLPTVGNQPLRINVEMTPLVLPRATGGNGTIAYALDDVDNTANATGGDMPPGLAFTAETRVLSGTPTTIGTYNMSYTAVDSSSIGTPETATQRFTITVSAAPMPTTGDKGQITEFKLVGDVVDKTIASAKRHHVMEGSQGVDLSVTVQWDNSEVETIGYDMPQRIEVMIMEERGTRALPNWLSWIDPDGQDVHFPRTAGVTGTVTVRTPRMDQVPASQRGSDRHHSSATGTLDLLILHDDHEAENDAFYIEAIGGDVALGNIRGATDRTTLDVVIEDDEDQKVVIRNARRSTGPTSVYEPAGSSTIDSSPTFTVSASPARNELPLEVRLDMVDLNDQTVSAAQISLSAASLTLREGGTGSNSGTVDVNLPDSDGNRMDDDYKLNASVNVYSVTSGGYRTIPVAEHAITVIDRHKLPTLAVSSAMDTVAEGDTAELTLTINRNPSNTTVSSTEQLQYTQEAVTVMLSMGDGSTASAGDYSLMPASVTFPARTRGAYTASMTVDVMATEDDELDDMEMLVLDADVTGGVAANGTDADMYMGVSTLTIEEGTMKYVWAKAQQDVEDAVYAAKEAGAGADKTFTAGEMIEVMGSTLFNHAEGVTLSFTAESDNGDAASAMVNGGTVMVTAKGEGMAHITITAHASMPSGVKIVDQSDPRSASVVFPVEVGLEALTIMLSGPEDMNVAEGKSATVTATANRAVTEDTMVMLMRDRAMSSASDADYTAEAITIAAGEMMGSTMVMAVEDSMAEDMEELVLYGMTEGMAGEVTGEVKLYLWDAAVPALPVIAQLLLAAFLAVGGYRRYRRR